MFDSQFRNEKTLKLFKVCVFDKISWSITSFLNFRRCHFGLWFVNYTPVMWPSQWCHQSSSFHKRYPWSKFQVHTIPRSWDTRGCTPPPSCTVTKVEKGCTVERLIYESRHCEHECVFVGLFFVKEHFVCLPPLNRCHF